MENEIFSAFIIVFVVLASVFAIGALIAYLAFALSRFFNNNVPSPAALDRALALRAAPKKREAREPIELGPNAEPFILATIGFIVVFIIALMVVIVPPHGAEGAPGTPAIEQKK
ncbi:MAG: hypothetical protein KA750_06345 [Thermoflexales bacterium]|jgi:hypothetical protein|nr:hypothetical protein [Thermoflexales bacterium]MBP8241469.1 hypothetical protein [Thermoflexales bacterium]